MPKWTILILTEQLIKKKGKLKCEKPNLILAKASGLVKVEWMERRDQHG